MKIVKADREQTAGSEEQRLDTLPDETSLEEQSDADLQDLPEEVREQVEDEEGGLPPTHEIDQDDPPDLTETGETP